METTRYYDTEVRIKHPDIKDEWVERVVSNPYRTEVQADGRIRYYGYIAEEKKWLRVIVEDGKLLTRFFDHHKLREWGPPMKLMKLRIYYDSETDTLSLWNGQPGNEGADVAENLTVDLNSEGEAVGFTLEHAAELLESAVFSPRTIPTPSPARETQPALNGAERSAIAQ